jgi:predicted permease
VGRDFDAGDKPGAPLVAIVNQAFVRRLFPNQNPLGRSVQIPEGEEKGNYLIAGVVADTHYYDVHRAPEPFVWLSMAQVPPYLPTLHVRTDVSDTAAMIVAVRHEFDLLDQGFPVFNIRTMSARIEDSLAGERMVANLSGAFGVLALALAAVGLYGILAYSVSRRTREIGIRMALGAEINDVLRLVVIEGMAPTLLGIAVGLAGALALGRVLSTLIYGVRASDPLTIGAVSALLAAVALLATLIPAYRATRVEPMKALRDE